MIWWTTESTIPFEHVQFNQIITSLVFECPSATRKRVSNGTNEIGEKIFKEDIHPVSARNKVSFKARGITKDKLSTLLSQIKQPLVKNNSFLVIKSCENVDTKVSNMIATTTLADPYFELIVMKDRNEMPKTEAVFYYIRNAFAHGSFEVKNDGKENIYLMESAKANDIKARMRLRESTLQEYMRLSKLTVKEIAALQRSRKK